MNRRSPHIPSPLRLRLALLFSALIPLGILLFAASVFADVPAAPAPPDADALAAWVLAQIAARNYVALVPIVVYALVWLSRTDLMARLIPKLQDPKVSVILAPALGILTAIVAALLGGQPLTILLVLHAVLGALGGFAAIGIHQAKQHLTADPGNDGKGPPLVPVPADDGAAARLLSNV